MDKLAQVEAFWSAHPCDSERGIAVDRRRYFAEIEHARYSDQRYIPAVAAFRQFACKKVLEIGCGVGTDGRQFAKAGAIYTGINLDQGSTDLARESFGLFELAGTIVRMNAEHLEFPDSSFDHVYSMGVIHHSPEPQAIVAEAFRVLSPGGTIRAMIYNRFSINYYFNIMFLRRIFRYLLVPAGAPRVIARLTGLSEQKLARHREIFLSEEMTRERWISINTDGPDCPLSRVYAPPEALELFARAGFTELKFRVRFFNKHHYGAMGRVIPDTVAGALGRCWGWHLWIDGVKPRPALTGDRR